MNQNIVKFSRELMYRQTRKNKAPAWLLTELAIQKGKELARKYKVDEKLVLASLYLSHTVFSPIWHGRIQKKHPKLSADFVRPYLKKWGVALEERKIIINSIEAHHNQVATKYKIAEVVKNAECFKFVTLEGSLIWLHEAGRRGYSFKEAAAKVFAKMEQKRKLLTLKDCKKEAERGCKKIVEIFNKV